MAQTSVAQEKMQKFGRFLSGMVMPNIGAFIAWGLLTALFIPTGWLPNEYLAKAGAPMAQWLIPLLIGYSGGSAIYKHRGGVLGTIATAGIIAGSSIPMFLGAMIMGPLGGWCMKKFDSLIQDKIPTGFEMLINNFSAGILGAILALLAYVVVGPIVNSLNDILRNGVEAIVNIGLIPLVSILVEPAKVLFLNNAINHGVFTLHLLDGGLIAPASPGSIFAILAMTPKGAYFANIAAVVVATAVSFVISSIFIKASKGEETSLEEAQANMKEMKAQGSKRVESEKSVSGNELKKIVYACDAGMGSSAMGASALRNKLKKAGYGYISVTNCAIGNIPSDAQVVVSHEKLADRAVEDSPQAEHIFVQDFIKNDVFDIILAKLKNDDVKQEAKTQTGTNENAVEDETVLKRANIKMNLPSMTKEEAIKMAGELLYKSGYVGEAYINGMLAREKDVSTYMGRGIAIPHGENAVKDSVKQSGIVVLQFPEGVDFGTGKAKLVVGIAGKGDEHLAILANIAVALDEYTDEQLDKLFATNDKEALYNLFTKTNE